MTNRANLAMHRTYQYPATTSITGNVSPDLCVEERALLSIASPWEPWAEGSGQLAPAEWEAVLATQGVGPEAILGVDADGVPLVDGTHIAEAAAPPQ
jgi:hypothetical protein